MASVSAREPPNSKPSMFTFMGDAFLLLYFIFIYVCKYLFRSFLIMLDFPNGTRIAQNMKHRENKKKTEKKNP